MAAPEQWTTSLGRADDPAFGIEQSPEDGFAAHQELQELGSDAFQEDDFEGVGSYEEGYAAAMPSEADIDEAQRRLTDVILQAGAAAEGDAEEEEGAGFAARSRRRGGGKKKKKKVVVQSTKGKVLRATRVKDNVIEWEVSKTGSVPGAIETAERLTTSSSATVGKNLAKLVNRFADANDRIMKPLHVFMHRRVRSVVTAVARDGKAVCVRLLNMFTGQVQEMCHVAPSTAAARSLAGRLREALSKGKDWSAVAHGDVTRVVRTRATSRRASSRTRRAAQHKKRIAARKRKVSAMHRAQSRLGYAATAAGGEEEGGYAARSARDGKRFARFVEEEASNWSCLGGGGGVEGDAYTGNTPTARIMALANGCDASFRLRDEMRLIDTSKMRTPAREVLGVGPDGSTAVTPADDLDARARLATGLLVFSAAVHMVCDMYELDIGAVKARAPTINIQKETDAIAAAVDTAMTKALDSHDYRAAQFQGNRVARSALARLATRSNEGLMDELARKMRFIDMVCSRVLATAYNTSLMNTLASVPSVVRMVRTELNVSYGLHNLVDAVLAVFAEAAMVTSHGVGGASGNTPAERTANASVVAAVGAKLKTQLGDADFSAGLNRSIFNTAPSMTPLGLMLEQMITVTQHVSGTVSMLFSPSAGATKKGTRSATMLSAMSAVLAHFTAIFTYLSTSRANGAALVTAMQAGLGVEPPPKARARGYAAEADGSDGDGESDEEDESDEEGDEDGGAPEYGDAAELDGYAVNFDDALPFTRVDLDAAYAAAGQRMAARSPPQRVVRLARITGAMQAEHEHMAYLLLKGTTADGRAAYTCARTGMPGLPVYVDETRYEDDLPMAATMQAFPRLRFKAVSSALSG